jgi:predicted dehydrogenase
MSKKGIGIIGYGGFGAFMHKAWDAMSNAGVVAVCDSDPTRLPDGVTCYSDYNDLLADQSVDIVSIATPPSSHKDLALKAFAAGKHTLIEKPLALSPDDTAQIIDAACAAGVKASVNFVLRYNPIVIALEEIAKAGILGKLRRMDLRNYAMQETVPKGHWFWNPEISGRILLEHGVHFFDMASTVAKAKAVDCWSLGVEREKGMEDRVFAAVKYDNDVVGTFWHSFSRPRELERTTFHFAFDMGEIDVIGWIPLEMKIWGSTDQAGLEKLWDLNVDITFSPALHESELSSEFTYATQHEIKGGLELAQPKLEVYADGLRHIMVDLIESIENSEHQMRVSLDDAAEAVKTAYRAMQFAHPK